MKRNFSNSHFCSSVDLEAVQIQTEAKEVSSQLNSLKPKGFNIQLPKAVITDEDLFEMILEHPNDLRPTGYTTVGQLIQSLLIEELCSITTQLQSSKIIPQDYHQETLKNNIYILSTNIIDKILGGLILNLRVPTLTVEIIKQLYNHDLETLKY